MTDETRIDLLRHGECEGQSSIYRGVINVPLSSEGWKTMERAVNASEKNWDVIITSPKQRCKRFAMDLAEQLKTPFEINSGFQEINFGRWEGMTFKDVWKAEAEQVKAFYTKPETNPHNGESVADMTRRVIDAWQTMLEQHSGKRILLVNHGGIMRVLLSELLSIPMSSVSRMDVPYGCFTRFKVFSQFEDGNVSYHPMLQFHNKSG